MGRQLYHTARELQVISEALVYLSALTADELADHLGWDSDDLDAYAAAKSRFAAAAPDRAPAAPEPPALSVAQKDIMRRLMRDETVEVPQYGIRRKPFDRLRALNLIEFEPKSRGYHGHTYYTAKLTAEGHACAAS